MRYAYYPGCSLTSSAREYDVATRAVLAHLGCEVTEIEDWTCCGASAAEAVSELLQLALPARNLALAAATMPGADFFAPCSACYLNHLHTIRSCEHHETLSQVNEALSAETAPDGSPLVMPSAMRVRHLLDLLCEDVGLEAVAAKVVRPLEGVVLAPYYGCQILRPYHAFDDPERPQTLHKVLEALGAEAMDWSHANKCCSASLMATCKDAALPSVSAILTAAGDADAVVTVCPLCHMNLEAYQSAALEHASRKVVDVLYLPQLMGLAFGMEPKAVRVGGNMAAATCVETIISGAKAQEKAAP